MQHEHVVIAAFSTESADNLPRGWTRVATIHLQTSGAVDPQFELVRPIAAGMDGNRIPVETKFEEKRAK